MTFPIKTAADHAQLIRQGFKTHGCYALMQTAESVSQELQKSGYETDIRTTTQNNKLVYKRRPTKEAR